MSRPSKALCLCDGCLVAVHANNDPRVRAQVVIVRVQIVISGTRLAVDRAGILAKAAHKRAVCPAAERNAFAHINSTCVSVCTC